MFLMTVQVQLGGHSFCRALHPGESSLWSGSNENRKTGAGQVLTWHSARFVLGEYSIVLSGYSHLLVWIFKWFQPLISYYKRPIHARFEGCVGAIGELLQLEKNIWRILSSTGGGMLDA